MAYNRKNLLGRMIEIQQITLSYTNKGVSQEWVLNNIINTDPIRRISRRTFYSYLATPAKMQLKKIEEQPKQLEIGL